MPEPACHSLLLPREFAWQMQDFGVVHGFASSIGGLFDIPHGLICGTLMAKSNEINIRELRKKAVNSAALKKYADLGDCFLKVSGIVMNIILTALLPSCIT